MLTQTKSPNRQSPTSLKSTFTPPKTLLPKILTPPLESTTNCNYQMNCLPSTRNNVLFQSQTANAVANQTY